MGVSKKHWGGGAGLARSFLPWGAFLIALLILPFLFQSNGGIVILTQMAITIVFALSYNMLLGQTGMLSFGHAVYLGVGGFMCLHILNAVEEHALPVPLPLLPLFAGLFSMGVATVIGSFSTRRAGVIFAMISLGIVELVASFSIIIVGFFGYGGVSGDRTMALPFFGVDFASQIEVYYLICFWLILSVAMMYFYTRTPLGRMANAVRDNPERAEFVGFSARWVRFFSFCAAGFFAGVAGGLSAISYEISTAENLTLAASGTILLVTFLGGIGTFYGPIIGAVVFTLIRSVLSFETELWSLYLGALFLATVMYFPGGLAGVLQMHEPVLKYGRWRGLIGPYLAVLVPAGAAILGACALIEMSFHSRGAGVGESGMRLYWMSIDSHDLLPWAVAVFFGVGGIWAARRAAPALQAAWVEATQAEA